MSSRRRWQAILEKEAADRSGWPALRANLLLVAWGAGLLYLASRDTWIATGLTVLVFLGWIAAWRDRRRMEGMARERQGESICGFARAFPRREVDPLLIRAVYESVQSHLGVPVILRGQDRFVEELNLDDDDLDEIAMGLARMCGYSMKHGASNPFWGNVKTLSDLVYFLHHQPRTR